MGRMKPDFLPREVLSFPTGTIPAPPIVSKSLMTLTLHQCHQLCPTIHLSSLITHWTGDNISGAFLAWLVGQRNQITDVLATFLVSRVIRWNVLWERVVLSVCGRGASL